MPYFSEASSGKLSGCHPRLQEVCRLVIPQYDFTVLEGHRSNERQEELFRQGKSQLRAGASQHNKVPSLAVDLAPFPIDWDDTARFYLLAGFMFQAAGSLDVRLRWGGDWDNDWNHKDQSFHDLPHFEVLL